MKNPKARITIDPEMARYDNVSLFPEKVARAKELLAKTDIKKIQELATQTSK